MCEDNHTEVSVFFLVGFQNLKSFKILSVILFVLVYIIIISANLLIVVLVSVSEHLKNPMYFFLKHLALADMLVASNIVPQLLYVIMQDGYYLSASACIFHYYVFNLLGIVQSFILTIMSYDRYLAICNPLHYYSLMTVKNCHYLVRLTWLLTLMLDSTEIGFMYQMKFCDSNIIDHFFCDITSILNIATSDTIIIAWQDFALSLITIFFPFLFITVSYAYIFITIIKMPSFAGRKKAFSTCSSHLSIVCIYYGTLIALYVFPSGNNFQNENKIKSLINVLLTPLINPLIYSLRNKEIIRFINKLIHLNTMGK
ncbi:olfactory receptor 1M1-like [Lithobates pipiens]